ncbi:MAG TPA: PEP-utilizing enzyme [Pseudonocardiaceae bacterium]
MTQKLVGTGLNVSQHEGTVRGRVRYVASPADVVTLMRDPDIGSTVVLTQGGAVTFAGALLPKRPAGLVTIEGAPESHLGIVSREFSIPAVMSVELTDAEGVQRVGANGLTTRDYVEHVVSALNDRLIEIDCQDPDTGRLYLV